MQSQCLQTHLPPTSVAASSAAARRSPFLVEWKDWPSPASWTKEPYENFGDFKALADAFKAEWVASGKPWPPTEGAA